MNSEPETAVIGQRGHTRLRVKIVQVWRTSTTMIDPTLQFIAKMLVHVPRAAHAVSSFFPSIRRCKWARTEKRRPYS